MRFAFFKLLSVSIISCGDMTSIVPSSSVFQLVTVKRDRNGSVGRRIGHLGNHFVLCMIFVMEWFI